MRNQQRKRREAAEPDWRCGRGDAASGSVRDAVVLEVVMEACGSRVDVVVQRRLSLFSPLGLAQCVCLSVWRGACTLYLA
jgi:hypothetical protein